MIALDITSVTNEIFALTALRKIVNPAESTPEVLCRDQLPALRVLVRSAFSGVAVSLAPYLAGAACDPVDPPAEHPYSDRTPLTLEFDFGASEQQLTSGMRLTLKRYLEHLVALHVMGDVFGPLETAADRGARSAEADTLLSLIRGLLRSTPEPLLIRPAHY